jgi:hypothetical protein
LFWTTVGQLLLFNLPTGMDSFGRLMAYPQVDDAAAFGKVG